MKAMIISVGGTPDPIVHSLLDHRPEYVCFFASQQSLDKIGEIKTRIGEAGLCIEDYKVICDDAENLEHCYSKALHCAEKLKQMGVQPGEIVVDYTGGTKTMTAALALATVGQGCVFSYVGGTKREKDGLGVVKSGSEVISKMLSPWEIFAVEEKKRISLFVTSFQYEAAISIIGETSKRLEPRDRLVWEGLGQVLEGYLAWDNFDHKKALLSMSAGLKSLVPYEHLGADDQLKNFLGAARKNFEQLVQVKDATSFFSKKHPLLVCDLVSNAKRRYLQSKFDDAVARLYRALEMAGQIAFEEATGSSTSDVSTESLPESIRKEYMERYFSRDDGKMRLPLFPTFRALEALGHSVGLKFFKEEESLKKILSARNSSILAHGTQPIRKETCEAFIRIVKDLFAEGPDFYFPKMNW